MGRAAFVSGFLLACLAGAFAQERTIVLLGASTASGTGASTYDSSFAGRYAHYLQSRNPAWTLTNLAVSGYTTFQLMPTGYVSPSGRSQPDPAHNITKALALHPRVLLLCMGTNDIANGYPASEYESNYDTLHAMAESAGIPLWITTPLPRALDATGRNKILALRDRIMTRYAPRALNFYDSLGDSQGNYIQAFNSGDGIHTNNHGHRLLYERVVAADLIGSVTFLARGDAAGRAGASAGGNGAFWFRDPGTYGEMLFFGPGAPGARDLRGRGIGP
ncbi:MAG: SGNH/GDSL hydrolase family protein [Fibrobacteres bacterium]|jgi:lysophospholipase L1-like esterase|nr:SGNH/GDSL hydrolase family protein [Fibrobacterota bacterium]